MRIAFGCALIWLIAWSLPVLADGGTVRLSETRGDYRVTVFTTPTPFRAGPVDVSVLVQNGKTGEPMPDAHVVIRMSKSGGTELEYPATLESATNKLFRAAQFELPEAGLWKLSVEVDDSHGKVAIYGNVEAGDPLPRWSDLWAWVGWPVLVIAVFGIHRVMVQRELQKQRL